MVQYGAIESVQSVSSFGVRRVVVGAVIGLSAIIACTMVVWNASPSRLMLFQSNNLFNAEQAVAIAQARVERDLEQAGRIRRPIALSSISGDVLRNGPQAKVKAFPDPTENDQAVLETPDEMYTKTPRLKRHNAFGPNQRYCPGGNCENFDAAGVVSDRWPTDVYSAVPLLGFDPDSSPIRNRDLNQREGEFARNLHPENYHAPVGWGVGTAAGENPDGYEGKGTVADVDRGVAKLEENGVNHDNWPMDLYSGFPWPAWDKSEYDQKKHKELLPAADPLESIDDSRNADAALRAAGVTVNHSPFDEQKREYNSVDGLMDKLVPAPAVPKWNKGGAAPQDLPASFLLREHPDMAGPQPEADPELGVEVEQPAARPRNVWDSLGCGPQGCFAGRDGEEFERPE